MPSLVQSQYTHCLVACILIYLLLSLGAGGGIVSMMLTYPLVSVSSRLQVQKNDDGKDAYKVHSPLDTGPLYRLTRVF